MEFVNCERNVPAPADLGPALPSQSFSLAIIAETLKLSSDQR